MMQINNPLDDALSEVVVDGESVKDSLRRLFGAVNQIQSEAIAEMQAMEQTPFLREEIHDIEAFIRDFIKAFDAVTVSLKGLGEFRDTPKNRGASKILIDELVKRATRVRQMTQTAREILGKHRKETLDESQTMVEDAIPQVLPEDTGA